MLSAGLNKRITRMDIHGGEDRKKLIDIHEKVRQTVSTTKDVDEDENHCQLSAHCWRNTLPFLQKNVVLHRPHPTTSRPT